MAGTGGWSGLEGDWAPGDAAMSLAAMLPPAAHGLLAAVMPGGALCSNLSRRDSLWSVSTSATCGMETFRRSASAVAASGGEACPRSSSAGAASGGVLARCASVRVQPIVLAPTKDSPPEPPFGTQFFGDEPIKESEESEEHEDELDRNVFRYLRENPRVTDRHTLVRKEHGVYALDGREVQMEWRTGWQLESGPLPVVVDGPLRQPLAEYMEMSEASAEYEEPGAEATSALFSIPTDRWLSFDDEHKKYSRLEAMKVAKEQALVRAKAAEHVKDGRAIPVSLLERYNRTIEKMKPLSVEEVLDRCRWTAPTPGPLAGSRGGC